MKKLLLIIAVLGGVAITGIEASSKSKEASHKTKKGGMHRCGVEFQKDVQKCQAEHDECRANQAGVKGHGKVRCGQAFHACVMDQDKGYRHCEHEKRMHHSEMGSKKSKQMHEGRSQHMKKTMSKKASSKSQASSMPQAAEPMAPEYVK